MDQFFEVLEAANDDIHAKVNEVLFPSDNENKEIYIWEKDNGDVAFYLYGRLDIAAFIMKDAKIRWEDCKTGCIYPSCLAERRMLKGKIVAIEPANFPNNQNVKDYNLEETYQELFLATGVDGACAIKATKIIDSNTSLCPKNKSCVYEIACGKRCLAGTIKL